MAFFDSMVELVNSFPDFNGSFGDKRLEKRAQWALNKLTVGRNSSIRQITQNQAEQKSIYRLLENDSFSEKAIEASIVNKCAELSVGRHLLCIQDTTEFNLSGQENRLKQESGIGTTSNKNVLGFFMHSGLVIDAVVGSALGYSGIKLWHRKATKPDRHKRNYQQQQISEKESNKWLEVSKETKKLLSKAKTVTIIADRESDIYDLLAGVPDEKTHLLIRSSSDRKLEDGNTLATYFKSLPIMHQYILNVQGDIRKGVKKRKATLQMKWGKVKIKKPKTSHNVSLNKSIELNVLEVKEKNLSNGIYWRILTTHEIKSKQQALQVVEWYKQRWYIEQIHRLLKNEGIRIERSQLESGWSIRKLTLLSMMAVLRILQMMLAYEDETGQPIEEVFNKSEHECLTQLNNEMQGETLKQKNLNKINTLKWASWVIARLGGWKGYKTQRKPGPIVLQKGLIKFYHLFEGWILHQKYFKNVYTQ